MKSFSQLYQEASALKNSFLPDEPEKRGVVRIHHGVLKRSRHDISFAGSKVADTYVAYDADTRKPISGTTHLRYGLALKELRNCGYRLGDFTWKKSAPGTTVRWVLLSPEKIEELEKL